MKELGIQEMTSLRGGVLDFSHSLNHSNIAAILSLGNTANSAPINVSVGGQGDVLQEAGATAGSQSVTLAQLK
jgi:hypothetical protein